MYFTVNVAFVDYIEQLNETITKLSNRNWTNIRQSIPISLDSFQVSSKLMQVLMMLKDFIEQYQENRITATKWEDPTMSFLVDTLIFIAAILTVFLVFVIVYIIIGQSKLKTLVTTMALQRVKAVEALNANRQAQSCNSELLKILMILNLVIVVSLLLKKLKRVYSFEDSPSQTW